MGGGTWLLADRDWGGFSFTEQSQFLASIRKNASIWHYLCYLKCYEYEDPVYNLNIYLMLIGINLSCYLVRGLGDCNC
jgi:hypothetical protein